MIKEKKKITKYNFEKSKKQIILEYIRTILCSIAVAFIFTTSLAMHARNEMIKNIYANEFEQEKLDKQVALQLITQTDLMSDLNSKKYSVCMHVGELYETAGDYYDAQKAYELAVEKAKPGVFKPYYKLINVLTAQEKFDKADALLDNIKDYTDKDLIKFKTRSYLTIGDKYYSIVKILSAAKNYEKANFYYSKFTKKDKVVLNAITTRIVNAYIQTADIMVKSGLNSDAVRFLHKALKFAPDNFDIKYRLAIVLSDSDPEKSIEYLEKLLTESPQDIDYGIYGRALLKAANIADLDNRPTQAKYYRYKIHSIDLFLKRKVVYKNDVEIFLQPIMIRKVFFTYPLNLTYGFRNYSNQDIVTLNADFVLCDNDKPIETITRQISNKDKPLLSYADTPNMATISFKKKVFTRKELGNYTVKIYLYKDEKYKTHAFTSTVPYNKKASHIVGEAEDWGNF